MHRAVIHKTVIVIVLLIQSTIIHAQFTTSTADLWDVSNGIQVTDNSALKTPDARDMFGLVSAGSPEPGNLIFADSQPQGFVHYVEWMTPSAISLRSFVLNFAHDGPPRDAGFRGDSEFLLYVKTSDTGEFDQLVFQYTLANPYGDSEPPPNGGVRTNNLRNELSLCVNIPSTIAQEFRAEFVQYGVGSAAGPRIFELDGYDEQIFNCVDDIFKSGFESGE